MNKIFKGITLIVLLLSSASVYALDGDFYVYEGFNQTVSALKALSLIFHDHQFQVLAGVFATIGLFSEGSIWIIQFNRRYQTLYHLFISHVSSPY